MKMNITSRNTSGYSIVARITTVAALKDVLDGLNSSVADLLYDHEWVGGPPPDLVWIWHR